jgi:hypothetical protein
LTGRADFFAGGVTEAVALRRAALVAGTAGDVRGVVTGDTDDLPGRRRDLSGGTGVTETAVQGNTGGCGGMPERRVFPLLEQMC